MNKNIRQFTLMMFFVVMMFTCKIDVNAATDIISDVIWNTNGEKRPENLTVEGYSDDYVVKYWTGTHWGLCGFESFASWNKEHQLTNITYEVEYRYDLIDEMTTLVNQERKKKGVEPLKVTDDMTRIAMQRAAECALYWSHTRPNGMDGGSLSCLPDQENISADTGTGTAKRSMDVLVNSPGHYKNIINANFIYGGWGAVTVKINSKATLTYWVQVFADGKGDYYPDGYPDLPYDWKNATYTKKQKYKEKVTISICSDYLNLNTGFYFKDEMIVGESQSSVDYELQTSVTTTQNWNARVRITPDQYTIESLNDCLKIENGTIKAIKTGKGKIKFTLKANKNITFTEEILVKNKSVKNGSKLTVSGNSYKVTSTKSKTVSFYSGKKNTKMVSIPKTVKIQGKTYKVTSIAANAFKDNKMLTSVTVGANITTIGSKAFCGCKNLKKITVKSTRLKSVGKSSLKGIHKKAVLKVPKSKLQKYKKLFKNKGQKKTVKIKK